jgi:RNA polymerase sigma-70 factor (ECF subfamily)
MIALKLTAPSVKFQEYFQTLRVLYYGRQNLAVMINMSSEEYSLVQKAKAGERGAFEQLYQKYKRPILNYTYRFIGNFAHAEELCQETFVRAYLNIHRYEPRAKFSSWLYRIATNLAKNHLRHAHYERRHLIKEEDIYPAPGEQEKFIENIEDAAKKPDELLQQKEEEALIQKAIEQLPTHLKEAVILCDIEGKPYEEAADIMHCKPMTVGSRLSRAREKLAEILKRFKNGEQ